MPRKHRSGALRLVALAGLAMLAATARAADESGGPQRVISVGGAVTEIVHALGAGDRLVAVDSTSTYPGPVTDLPDVGYMRQLSAEPILALEPSLVLAAEDAGPPTTLEQLRAAGTRVVTVPDDPSPRGVAEKIRHVGGALSLETAAERLAGRVEREFRQLRQALGDVERRPRVLFLLSVDAGAPMAAGRATAAHGIIELSAARNAMKGFRGYKPASPEAIIAAEPDYVLVTPRTLERLGGREALLERPAIASTPAGEAGQVVTMDSLFLLGFGPRTPAAARQLAVAIHPALGTDLARE